MNREVGEVRSMLKQGAASQSLGGNPAGSVAAGIGERVRQLRTSAGMTQSQLAGERFSKEYVSQIERGKTRPTAETIKWLASRLGVDAAFLANGVAADHRDRVEAAVARAEALTESDNYGDALPMYEEVRQAVAVAGLAELQVRAAIGEAKALVRSGEVRGALELLKNAWGLCKGTEVSDVQRAQVLYRMGVCRFLLGSMSLALGLLNQALELAESSGLPCDAVVSDILHWRSRYYRQQRDYEAAREDVERALELAQGLSDRRSMGHLYFQASLIAEREGHWVLARSYAERAKTQYEEVADRENVGRLLNNLGGISFLLGSPEKAVRYLKDAFANALEVGSEADAAQAVNSLAQVHLRTGEVRLAEEQARHALQLLDGRVDFLSEIGNAQLVLGRALLEQGRFDEAEDALATAYASFDQLSLASQKAAVWIAQGDLATSRGNDRSAARLYRLAAEALQDFRF